MLQFIAGRLVQMIPVLLGVSLIAFFSIHLVPGDPIEIMTMGRATPETIAAMHAEYGLDQPLWQQYLAFIGNALQGDLGRSIVQKTEVSKLIGDGIGVSLYLLAYSAALSVLIAVPLAMWAAVRRDSAPDHAVRLVGMIGLAHAAVLDRASADGGVRPDAALVSHPRLRRRILRPSPSHVPAGADHGAVPGADPDPVAALLHPRRAGGGLYRGRPCQGPVAAAHHVQAHPAQCGDSRSSRCWR